MTRKQFPVRLAFGITSNKAQGQTLKKVGICLRSIFFLMVNFMLHVVVLNQAKISRYGLQIPRAMHIQIMWYILKS